MFSDQKHETLMRVLRERDEAVAALAELLDWVAKDTSGRFNSITTPDCIVAAASVLARLT